MKNLILIAAFLLLTGCIHPTWGVYDPNRPYGTFGLMTLPDADKATMNTFSRVPQDYQYRYVAQISNTAQQNGLRCRPGSNVTNDDIYYEIMTRLNARKYTGSENLVKEQYSVMNYLGCNWN